MRPAVTFPSPREPQHRTLWERLRGDILVIGAKRQALFVVMYHDGAHVERWVDIPRSGVIKNDGMTFRIVSVPPLAKHGILWVSGPCAISLGRLMALEVVYPEVKRYLRRRRRRLFWLRMLGHV